jgi:hypothetical protein
MCSLRKFALTLLILIVASSASVSRCEAADAPGVSPKILTALSIDPDSVKYQARCQWWFAGGSAQGNDCDYVQTADSIYFLNHFLNHRTSRRRYEVKLQVRFEEIGSVALQSRAGSRQIQLRSRGDSKLLLFQMAGKFLTDNRKTEASYASLVESGVRAGEPVPWVGFPPAILIVY